MRKILTATIFTVVSTFAMAGGEIIPALDNIEYENEAQVISKEGEVYSDYKNKLVWQDEPYGDIEDGAYKHNRSEGKAGKWSYADKYCQDLYYAGYSDWRLPKVSELTGLYSTNHKLKYQLSVDFWTSTPSKGNKYWSVYTIMEGQPYEHKKNESQYIRCVRSMEI